MYVKFYVCIYVKIKQANFSKQYANKVIPVIKKTLNLENRNHIGSLKDMEPFP